MRGKSGMQELYSNVKWKFGTVTARVEKLHYKVRLDDGRSWTRHANQMRGIGMDIPEVRNSERNADNWDIEVNGKSNQNDKTTTEPVHQPRKQSPHPKEGEPVLVHVDVFAGPLSNRKRIRRNNPLCLGAPQELGNAWIFCPSIVLSNQTKVL